MPYYRKVVVDYLHTEEEFICECCRQNIRFANKSTKHRYKVYFKMIDGTDQNFCIICASHASRKPVKELAAQVRKLYLIK